MHYLDTRIHPYLPSLQPMWVKTFSKGLYHYRDNIPFGSFGSLDEFNWYNGSKPRFSHASGLYSPGHATIDVEKARNIDRILFERNRDSTFLLVDSGGYQVGQSHWPLGKVEGYVEKVLKWQEAIADLAVILEVPSWTKVGGGRIIDFDTALEMTNRNLKAYASKANGKLKFLNPVHGQTFEQGKKWFDATRWFNDSGYAVGWCFSALFSLNFYEAMRLLVYMIEQEHYPKYLHFLGKGSAQVAIIANVMRRAVPRCYPSYNDTTGIREPVIVTTDSSSEFQSTGRFANIYRRSIPAKDAKGILGSPFRIKSQPIESADRHRFPADRPYPDLDGPILGLDHNGVKFGDLLAPEGANNSTYNLDDVSQAILIAHAIWVKLDTYEKMSKLESSLRRISYAKLDPAKYDFADIMSRLIHESTNKGKISNLGDDLVSCTVGLWRVFKGRRASAEDRYRLLNEFKDSAMQLFNA